MIFRLFSVSIISTLVLVSTANAILKVPSGDFVFEMNDQMHSRLNSGSPAEFWASEMVQIETSSGQRIWLKDFELTDEESLPNGRVFIGENSYLEKKLTITKDSRFPKALLFEVTYTNIGKEPIKVIQYTQNDYRWKSNEKQLWSFQPASYTERPDWLIPMVRGFSQKNFMGMNSTDYGNGTPVTAVWNRNFGIAVGSVAKKPQLISLPTEYSKRGIARLRIQQDLQRSLEPNESFTTIPSFVADFKKDMFATLRNYSGYMKSQGLKMFQTPMSEMGPIWCGWGYGRNFTVNQIIESIPIAKSLGFEWVGIDDGWQISIGDWQPNPAKFPNGDADIKRLVDEIHKHGMKAMLWWAPLAAHQHSNFVAQHRDSLIMKDDGQPREITYWDSWYLCPADKFVNSDTQRLTKKFIGEWGFDGLKLDGQHLNSAGECHNPKHQHKSAKIAFENHSFLFRKIMDEALAINSKVLVENCPCGTSYSIYNLPFQNMTVASDPENSRQVRQKGKVLRALTGDGVIYFGDHVELSDEGVDFASSIGIGALPGSNFTLAELLIEPPSVDEKPSILTDERRVLWKKWIPIAKEKRLWLGEYRGDLYDVGYDLPETHAVKKDGSMYYAFYDPKFVGQVELRGLDRGLSYEIRDYVNNRRLGKVRGPVARIKIEFEQNLLLEAVPIKSRKLE